jgi:hypothetical protein
MSNPWKRPFNFLNAYEPTALDGRSSKTVDTSPARPQKRQKVTGRDSAADGASVRKTLTKKRKVADPTFCVQLIISSDEDITVPAHSGKGLNRRKRLADPTFRLGTSSESKVGVVERRRERSKKCVTTKDKGLTKFLSLEAGHEMLQKRGNVVEVEDQHANRVAGDAMGVEKEVISRENEEFEDAKDERSDQEDDEDFVWERDWCRVM